MKALTISQPYATLIARGEKWVENRRWATDYRGPLAVHAGKGTQYLDRQELADYPTGCVIALARLAECVRLQHVRTMDRDYRIESCGRTVGEFLDHEHTEGPWCWILADVVPIEWVPCRGERGLWEWDRPKEGVGPARLQRSLPEGYRQCELF